MAFQGCLVNRTADSTSVNFSVGNVTLLWNNEIYDTDGYHDNVTSSERITIPAAVNGKYGIFVCTLSLTSYSAGATDGLLELDIIKNGANMKGSGACTVRNNLAAGNGQSSTSCWLQATATPQLLTTNDFYGARTTTGNGTGTIKAHSSFGLYVHSNPTVLMQCLAVLNGDKTAQDYTTAKAIAWDGPNVYDTSAIHNASVNNTQLIIPAALNGKYVVVTAMVAADNGGGSHPMGLAIRYNGSLTYNGLGARSDTYGGTAAGSNQARIGCQTPAIQVSTGDTFDAFYFQGSDTNLTFKADKCSFGLRVVG